MIFGCSQKLLLDASAKPRHLSFPRKRSPIEIYAALRCYGFGFAGSLEKRFDSAVKTKPFFESYPCLSWSHQPIPNAFARAN